MNSWKSAILHCDGLLLSKLYKVSAKTAQKSYLSWHWRVMQSQKKLTCGFKYDMRKLLNFYPTTQKSGNLTLMGSFCPEYISAKKVQRSYFSWHWTMLQDLNKPWPCCFKYSMRNWVNFWLEQSNVWKIVLWWALFV